MITVNHLRKSFRNADGTPLEVLRDVSCEIRQGDVISVIGPSGSGKSTFLHLLNLLERPDGGEIILDGENILQPGYPLERMRRKVGMVFQQFNLFEHMTVLENVTFAPHKLLKLSEADARKEAVELLRKVGMAEKADAAPRELSGGQKQRVAIARALAMHPEVILFDEPTSSLDPTMAGEVLSVIRQLAREKMTMLIVTHEMSFARSVSSRVFFMNDGVIYEEGTPKQVFDAPCRSATRAFVQGIRKVVFDIEGDDFDFFGMQTEISRFCIKYDIPEKINPIEHIVEEMVHVILSAYRPLRVVISHGELAGETAVAFMMKGRTVSPLQETEPDPISMGIVRGMSRTMIEETTRLGFRIKLIL